MGCVIIFIKNGTRDLMSMNSANMGTVMIATDNTADAEVVRQQLQDAHCKLCISTDPDRSVQDFERHAPDVLVLAFNTLEKSERYYLGLYRQSIAVQQQPHRTIILCNKEDLKRVCELCMKNYFDDYILFWPMTYDTSRLPMSVHNALRELSALKENAPSPFEFAAHARQISGLEQVLEQHVAQGKQHIDLASRAMKNTEKKIGAALDNLSSRITSELPESGDPNTMRKAIARLKQEDIQQTFRTAMDSVKPLKQWNEGFREECAPHLESARTLNAMVKQVRPKILVVDDDPLILKIISRMLESESYELVFAKNGIEALTMLRKMRPDLILLDFVMPDMDGLETLQRLKNMPHLVSVPVIMVTGKSEGDVVVNSIKAGARSFMVKPFNQNTLITKITQVLHTPASQALH